MGQGRRQGVVGLSVRRGEWSVSRQSMRDRTGIDRKVNNPLAQQPPAVTAGADLRADANAAGAAEFDVDSAGDRTEAAMSAPLRLMAVHAHPDDESSKGAASLAKYTADGVGVVVVSCTGGERGDVLNKKLSLDG